MSHSLAAVAPHLFLILQTQTDSPYGKMSTQNFAICLEIAS